MKIVISTILTILLIVIVACNETSNVVENGKKKYIFYTEGTDTSINIHRIDMESNQDTLLINFAFLMSSPVNNRMVYTSIDFNGEIGTIITSDINGQNKNVLVSGEGVFFSHLSPDASKVIYFIRGTDEDYPVEIHVLNFDGTNDLKLYSYLQSTDDYLPVAKFSSDSKKIAFVTHGFEDNDSLYIINTDGSNLTLIGIADGLPLGIDWSPNGKKIACTVVEDEHQINIRSFNTDGTGSKLLTTDGDYKVKPVFSPDGSLITYYQDVCDIHIIHSDGSGHKKLTNNTGNDNDIKLMYPTWSPDGKLIVYPSTENSDGGDIYFGDELRTIDVSTSEIKRYAVGKQVINGYMYFTNVKQVINGYMYFTK